MRFKEYLAEDQYRLDVDAQKAWELLNEHCKDSLKDLNTPIVRGMKGFDGGFGVIHGAAGGRASRNTSNHYTVILDAVLPEEFPKRSKSIICANWDNRSHAMGYGGKMFAIIPYDGVKIGVCPHGDIWDTDIQIGGRTDEINKWNGPLQWQGVKETMTFSKMMAHLESAREHIAKHQQDSGQIDNTSKWLMKLKPGKIKEIFEAAYTKPFKLATTAESKIYNDGGEHELWIGGKCVAISMKVYKEMMTNLPDDEYVGGWAEPY